MSKDPNEIEDEIAQTRARIENRINNLGSQMTPTRIVEQAFGGGDMSPTETFEAIADRARKSPISTALVGAGLMGLFLAGRRDDAPQPRSVDRYSNPSDSSDPAERLDENITRLKESSAQAVESARTAASDAKERARLQATLGAADLKDNMASARETISQRAGDLAAKAGHVLEDAGDYASAAKHRAAEAAKAAPVRARAQSEAAVDWVRDNPVPAGLIALAAGAAVSSFFSLRKTSAPTSRFEASKQLHEEARHNPDDMVFIGHPDDNLKPGKHVDPTPEKSRARAASKRPAGESKAASKTVRTAKAAKPKTATQSRNVTRSTAVLGEATKNAKT